MNQDNKDEVVYLYLDDIIPNRFQPREVFDEKALKELAVSIKEHGVIQPIIVRNVNGKYEIIAGERRYKASALAGLTKIPAIIRDLDDKESSKVALLENLQRKNLNAIEEARTYQKILELDEMTQDELAKTMGKSQSAVANKIRLLSLPDEVQDAVLKEKISERHARALLNIPDAKKQKEMLKKVISERITVRNLEQMIKENYPTDIKKGIEDIVDMNNQAMQIPDSKTVASTTDFVNNNPLTPTAELPEETSNYGKVIIAPPEGETIENTPKFINYGEIDDDEDDANEEKSFVSTSNPTVDDIKSNTVDINSLSTNQTTNLDGLLNIPTAKSENERDRFITPAEGIVKTDLEKDIDEKPQDYFKTPDLVSIELPSEVQTKATDNIPLNIEQKNKSDLINNNISSSGIESKELISKDNYSIKDAIELIRNLVTDLNNHNLNANMEEMDFSKSYQVIIKLDKTDIQ